MRNKGLKKVILGLFLILGLVTSSYGEVLEFGLGPYYNSYALEYNEDYLNHGTKFIKSYYGKLKLGPVYYQYDYTYDSFSTNLKNPGKEKRTHSRLKFELRRIGYYFLDESYLSLQGGYSLLSLNNRTTIAYEKKLYHVTYDKFNLPGYFFEINSPSFLGITYDKWYNSEDIQRYSIYAEGNLTDKLIFRTEFGRLETNYLDNVFVNFLFYLRLPWKDTMPH